MATELIGQQAALAGNQPLLLSEPDAVWIVEAEQAHVFAVRVEQGKPVGDRRYLFTAEVGEALFGLAAGSFDTHETSGRGKNVGLVAVGVPGARVQKLTWAQFEEHLSMELLERWVHHCSAAIRRELVSRQATVVEHGIEFALPAGQSAHVEHGLVWLSVAEGRLTFAGIPELLLHADTGLFPLSHEAWVQAAGDARIIPLERADVVRSKLARAGLHGFHALLARALELQAETAARAGLERMERRLAADRLALQQGYAHLVAAYGRRDSTVRLAAAAGEDPLLQACRLVGDALGVEIKAPAEWQTASAVADPLAAITSASQIRTREVLLSDGWWRRDSGPLLGFRSEDGHPVALLPTSGQRYQLVDPADPTPARVTAEVAASLARRAFCLYAPFPSKRLGARDLLRPALRNVSGDLLTILLIGAFGGLLGIATPLVTGLLIDQAIPSADHAQILQLALALAASAFGIAAFQVTRNIAMLRVEGRMDGTIQAGVWDRLLNLPPAFFRDYSSGDLAVRAMGVDVIRQALTGTVLSAILAAVFSLFSYALLFYYSPLLALVATALLALALGVTVVGNLAQLGYQRALVHLQGRISGLVLELLGGISKLRVAGAEQRAFGVWARVFGEQAALDRQAQTVSVGLYVFFSAFPLMTMLAVFAAVAAMRDGGFSTGAFLAFNAAFGQVMAAVLGLGGGVTGAMQVIPIYEQARPILESVPEADLSKADPGELQGDVEINRVSFRYQTDGPLVLNDVSFHARAGEFVALVGPSGSGKSTLMRLLLGFDVAESGSVYFDGQDLAGLDVRQVRRQLGVVLQGGKLVPGTIVENIIGSSRLTVEDAWEAARMAGLEQAIQEMPMGMQTVVMEGGATLSGGQRQRLMIARAVASRPRVLLFDEATSALDNQTQAQVGKSLEHLRATRIVIAHRLSTILKADRIYVLEAGRVRETGTYDELMRQGGIFSELARRQMV